MAQYSVDIVAKALGGSQVDQLANSFKNVDQAAAKAQGSLDRASNNIRNFGGSAKGAGDAVQALGGSLNGVVGKFAAFAAQLGLTVGAVSLFKSSLDAAFAREAAENRLQSLTDSAHEYELAMGAAEIASKRFGITQTEASNALGDIYGRLKGLGLNLAEVNQIYTGFNVIAREARTSTEDAAGAFLQLSQAMGSGKLQGDELKLILERMPQLAQAIADGMGVSAGSIRQLASDGKIGLTEIQTALAGAATRADDLGSTFTNQQATIAQVKQRWEELQVQIGETLAPTYLSAVEAISKGVFLLGEYMKGAAGWAEKNAKAIGDVVAVGLNIGKVALGIWVAVKAIEAYRKATELAALAQKILLAFSGPKGWAILAAGAVIATGAVYAFNKAQEAATAEIKRMEGESEKAYQARKAQVEAELNAQLKLKQGMGQQEQSAKDLKKAQDAVTKSIEDAITAAEQFGDALTQAVDNSLNITQARLQAEMAVNDVLLQQAERQLAAAQTQDQRVRAAQAVYQLTVRQAQLELESTRATIAAELDKARIAVESARVKEREVYAVVQLAIAQKSVTAAHYEALNAQRQAVGFAEQQLRTATVIAAEQNRAADAVYKGKVAAAEAAYQQNVVAQNTQSAASAAGQFANEMQRAAGAAQSAAGAMGAASGGTGRAPTDFGEAGKNAAFMKEYMDAINAYNRRQQKMFTDRDARELNAIKASFYDKAQSYNTAKASENMQSARADWSKYAGARGSSIGGGIASSAPQINLSFTGNIMRTPDGDYVKASEVPGIVGRAVNQTMNQLRRSPGSRAGVGMR